MKVLKNFNEFTAKYAIDESASRINPGGRMIKAAIAGAPSAAKYVQAAKAALEELGKISEEMAKARKEKDKDALKGLKDKKKAMMDKLMDAKKEAKEKYADEYKNIPSEKKAAAKEKSVAVLKSFTDAIKRRAQLDAKLEKPEEEEDEDDGAPSKEEQIKMLTSDIESYKESIKKLKDDIVSLKNDNEEIKDMIDMAKENPDDYEGFDIEEEKGRIEKNKKSIEDKRDEIENLEYDLETAQNNLEEVKNESYSYGLDESYNTLKHIKTFENFIFEGKGTKFKNKYDAAEYYDVSLAGDDADTIDAFMKDNKLSPEMVCFLSPMEAEWAKTSLEDIKKELDAAGVKNIMWDSDAEGESRLAFSTK